MEDVIYSDVSYYTRSAVAGFITVVGVLSNVISLSFFIRSVPSAL